MILTLQHICQHQSSTYVCVLAIWNQIQDLRVNGNCAHLKTGNTFKVSGRQMCCEMKYLSRVHLRDNPNQIFHIWLDCYKRGLGKSFGGYALVRRWLDQEDDRWEAVLGHITVLSNKLKYVYIVSITIFKNQRPKVTAMFTSVARSFMFWSLHGGSGEDTTSRNIPKLRLKTIQDVARQVWPMTLQQRFLEKYECTSSLACNGCLAVRNTAG